MRGSRDWWRRGRRAAATRPSRRRGWGLMCLCSGLWTQSHLTGGVRLRGGQGGLWGEGTRVSRALSWVHTPHRGDTRRVGRAEGGVEEEGRAGRQPRVSISNPEPRSIQRMGLRSQGCRTPLPACPLWRALPEAGPSLSARSSSAGRRRSVRSSRRASQARAVSGRGVASDVASRFDSPPLSLARI